eukprot:COSAG04_NODE_1265_length_7488_cov_2.080525_7_plen_143_part_00
MEVQFASKWAPARHDGVRNCFEINGRKMPGRPVLQAEKLAEAATKATAAFQVRAPPATPNTKARQNAMVGWRQKFEGAGRAIGAVHWSDDKGELKPEFEKLYLEPDTSRPAGFDFIGQIVDPQTENVLQPAAPFATDFTNEI